MVERVPHRVVGGRCRPGAGDLAWGLLIAARLNNPVVRAQAKAAKAWRKRRSQEGRRERARWARAHQLSKADRDAVMAKVAPELWYGNAALPGGRRRTGSADRETSSDTRFPGRPRPS